MVRKKWQGVKSEKKLDTLFDFIEDGEVIRMPFSVVEYSDRNKSIIRECVFCGNLYEQGVMKELSASSESSLKPVYVDKNKWYSTSIFICRTCWFENDISDASNWIA